MAFLYNVDNENKMNNMKTFVSALLAGISIALGGLIYLSLENRVIGAALFTIGLFCVCSFGFSLYTGKVSYALQNDRKYTQKLPLIWLGNLIGTFLTAQIILLSRSGPALSEKAAALCEIKLADNLVSLFVLGVLCNIFIYIAVESFRSNTHETGKYLALFLGVMGFILSGTEHCVADMFYFSLGKAWSLQTLICLLVITAGNSLGGILIACLHKFIRDDH